MKVFYETVFADKNSSFRALHVNFPVKDHRWEYHYHPEIELVCVISGTGSRNVGYHKSNYKDGDLVLIGSNIPHSGFGVDSADPHEEIVLQFKEEIVTFPKEVEEMSSLIRLMSQAQYGILFGHKVKQKIQPLFYKILETENSKRYFVLLNILFELAETHDYILLNKEIMPHTVISKNKERLQTIFTFVEKNYEKEIDINAVANMANLTLPAFCNFFKKTTKLTFTEFINQYRIHKACHLIVQGKSVSESCYETGYNSISYFSRTFKKYMGKTPTDFTNELLK
ncbi:AraC family transcriptional regulator [Chryseobacterium sp. SC28]|uniref:AraC family transcriptional regulator n=1 Tax=Chryseobacterium sp. SC28 TaxID=2268028 RepID=UPI000F650FA3|nr:AraC family transcriptional regulator [Chryseobacterium sp. SC28]RRQ45381.1 AraC family transcriptional regulator [Chryseobacterium sp. SC28]